jgi:hypothetical protein
MVVEKQDRTVLSQCKLRLPRMALFGCASTVCMNDTVILKIRAVYSTKMDSLTDTPCRNWKEVCNLINNHHQNLKTSVGKLIHESKCKGSKVQLRKSNVWIILIPVLITYMLVPFVALNSYSWSPWLMVVSVNRDLCHVGHKMRYEWVVGLNIAYFYLCL